MQQLTNSQVKFNLFAVLILWLAAIPAVLWLDRPLALWVHASALDSHLWVRQITEGLPKVLPAVVIVLLALPLLLRRKWWSALVSAVYFYAMLKLTMEIKTGLKIIFGRYWTKTWINHNLSLIHDNVFGFNWWHGFGNQGCFPSGHSTFTAFCCLWLIYAQPRYKYLWLAILVLMPVCLIALDYHFLGDCLAGLGLGTLCALTSYLLYSWWLVKLYKKSH